MTQRLESSPMLHSSEILHTSKMTVRIWMQSQSERVQIMVAVVVAVVVLFHKSIVTFARIAKLLVPFQPLPSSLQLPPHQGDDLICLPESFD